MSKPDIDWDIETFMLTNVRIAGPFLIFIVLFNFVAVSLSFKVVTFALILSNLLGIACYHQGYRDGWEDRKG